MHTHKNDFGGRSTYFVCMSHQGDKRTCTKIPFFQCSLLVLYICTMHQTTTRHLHNISDRPLLDFYTFAQCVRPLLGFYTLTMCQTSDLVRAPCQTWWMNGLFKVKIIPQIVYNFWSIASFSALLSVCSRFSLGHLTLKGPEKTISHCHTNHVLMSEVCLHRHFLLWVCLIEKRA